MHQVLNATTKIMQAYVASNKQPPLSVEGVTALTGLVGMAFGARPVVIARHAEPTNAIGQRRGRTWTPAQRKEQGDRIKARWVRKLAATTKPLVTLPITTLPTSSQEFYQGVAVLAGGPSTSPITPPDYKDFATAVRGR